MKIRNGFVSNSSSSSYVCEVCGDTFETWDEGISAFNLVMCSDYDHLFCDAHLINPLEDGTYTCYDDDNDDTRIDSIHCPICQMKEVTQLMVLQYALKVINISYDDMKKKIMEEFKTYDRFEQAVLKK